MSARRNKFLFCIIALVLVVCTLFTGLHPTIAFANEREINFDNTDVLEDLSSSTVNGKPFDIKNYPFDETKPVQIISFVEYCYSYRANKRDNYGLYLYVYNPKGLNLSSSDKDNKVQMAVSYNEEGRPDNFEKFSLQLCSKVESGNYKNLFYKFKVIDHKVNGKYFVDRVNSVERRYDISGIELLTYGANLPKEYNVGGTYKFTGYAKGYGPDESAENTLSCSVEKLETVELSVKHTFYRSNTSALGAGHQNQLDTVYFSVPQRLIEEYGRLQRIKAEWYEYKTKEIVVTSHKDFYTKASPYIGVNLGPKGSTGFQEYNEDIYYSLALNPGDGGGGIQGAKWGWNLGSAYLHPPCEALYYMFLVDNINEYDPYASIVDIGGIQSNDLYQYILNYDKTFESGTLPIKEGTISADLFEEDIDASRKIDNENGKIQKGYSYYDFDADVDLQVLKSWSDSSPSFWDNWVQFGLGAAFTGGPTEEGRTAPPIQILKESDIQGTNAEIANRLMINSQDVDALKKEYLDAITVEGIDDEEKVVVLFRFATSDYFSDDLSIMELGQGFMLGDKVTNGQAYMAQESVFLNFDIIQLTFNKDGVYTVIPVVSNPIDVISDVTPPVYTESDESFDLLKLIVGLFLLILLLWFLNATGALPLIGTVLVWVITAPFKFIKWLIDIFKGD